MLKTRAEQISVQLTEMLTIVKTKQASTSDMADMLKTCKSLNTKLSVLQTVAATAVARRENHRDGGAEVLRGSAGVSKTQARRRIRMAESLGLIPAVREAVEEGRISLANADALAKASRKTSPDAVQADPQLLAQASKMPQDVFAKQAQRWTAQRQHDHGEADHKRLRARRSLRFWSSSDGMTHLRGAFDPVAGERIRNRLEHIAAALHRQDRRQANTGRNADGASGRSPFSNAKEAGQRPQLASVVGHTPSRNPFSDTNGLGLVASIQRPGHANRGHSSLGSSRRSFEQCSADALEQLIVGNHPTSRSLNESGKNAPVQHHSHSPEITPAAGWKAGSGKNTPVQHHSHSGGICTDNSHSGGPCEDPDIDLSPTASGGSDGGSCGRCVENISPPVADILVYADIACLLPGSGSGSAFDQLRLSGSADEALEGFAAEIAGGGPIPPSVLERLMCNARVTGLLFDGPGLPLWCGRSRRTASAAQLKALRLRDRGCIGCSAHPQMCQVHHIEPWSQGGATDLDNLALVCYQCHHKIHDDNWQVAKTPNSRPIVQPPPAKALPRQQPEAPARTTGATAPPKHPRAHTAPQPEAPARTTGATAPPKHPRAHTAPQPEAPARTTGVGPPDRTLPLLC